jgi:CHAT domain-containing protein
LAVLGFEEAPAAPEAGVGAIPHLRRHHARLRADATAWFNLGLLALHHGLLKHAMAVAAQLMVLAEGTDSGLIRASAAEFLGFVAYRADDLGAAQRAAQEALAFYEAAGMTLRAWRTRTLLGWCLRRLGAGEGERLANARQVFALQARVAQGLEPADRARFRLNKWSIGEERLAAELAAGDSLPPLLLYHRLRRLAPRVDAGSEAARWRAEEDLSQGLVGFFAHTRARRGQLDLARRLHPRLLAADAALLHFAVLPDRVVLFVLTHHLGCRRLALATSRPRLWRMVEAVIGGLRGRPSWARNRADLAALAVGIGLDSALEMLPAGVERLAIVPDGILAHVPFAALPAGDGPLIARWSVELIPDPAWECRPTTGLPDRKPRLAVAASATAVPGFGPLPLAEDEVREVQAAAPGPWQSLAGPDATRSAVRGALSSVGAAHIVSHGEYVHDQPDRSGLALADGWLTAAEIARLGPVPTLVSLAACWAANAAVLPGALSVGLPHAFLAAGARHVIGALWPVFETSSASFSAGLYRSLAAGAPPPTALAAAQREAITADTATRIWAGTVCYASGAVPAPVWRRLLQVLIKLGL